MRKTALAAIASIAALISPAQATIVDLPANGQWSSFTVDSFVGPSFGNSWIDYADGSNLLFNFTIAAGQVGTLTLVDGGFAGDTYALTNFGSLIGSTSSVAQGDTSGNIAVDFDSALADVSFSRGVFTFAAGTYSIGGHMLQSVLDGGSPLYSSEGALKLTVAPVPEPATYALMLSGLLATTLVARRRNNKDKR
jgi:hypothetical protein